MKHENIMIEKKSGSAQEIVIHECTLVVDTIFVRLPNEAEQLSPPEEALSLNVRLGKLKNATMVLNVPTTFVARRVYGSTVLPQSPLEPLNHTSTLFASSTLFPITLSSPRKSTTCPNILDEQFRRL